MNNVCIKKNWNKLQGVMFKNVHCLPAHKRSYLGHPNFWMLMGHEQSGDLSMIDNNYSISNDFGQIVLIVFHD